MGERGIARGRVLSTGFEISIAAARESVFEFLLDLDNHWPLLGSVVRSSRKVEHPGGRPGATLVVGPPILPFLRRRVTTRVGEVERPSSLAGSAWTRETVAQIRWQLTPAVQGTTLVQLSVLVEPAGIVDRIGLSIGRFWWESRYRHALTQLAAEFGDELTAVRRIENPSLAFEGLTFEPVPA